MTFRFQGPSLHHSSASMHYYFPRNKRENVTVGNQMPFPTRVSGIVGVEIRWHTGTFAGMLSGGKFLEMITREGGILPI